MKDENIVKKVCNRFGITQKQLSECLKIDEELLKNIKARADIAYLLEKILKEKELPCKED